MNSISVKSFAKINHTLKITGRRDDGYHLIRSHMQAISLHDDVVVEIAPAPDRPGITSGGGVEDGISDLPGITVEAAFAPDAQWDVTRVARAMRGRQEGCNLSLPQGEDNIAYNAAGAALRRWGGAKHGQVRIRIAKRIPMAAGLAGGSADAAAVMLALARMLAPQTPLADIAEAGAEVGADVPFCISAIAKNDPALGYAGDSAAASSALCEGIGDERTPTDGARGFALLVKPGIDVSTPAVYEAWDKFAGNGSEGGNDLEDVAIALFPEIGILMNEVKTLTRRQDKGGLGSERVFMTGSGPTIVALYNGENVAMVGYEILAAAYKDRADIDAVIWTELL